MARAKASSGNIKGFKLPIDKTKQGLSKRQLFRNSNYFDFWQRISKTPEKETIGMIFDRKKPVAGFSPGVEKLIARKKEIIRMLETRQGRTRLQALIESGRVKSLFTEKEISQLEELLDSKESQILAGAAYKRLVSKARNGILTDADLEQARKHFGENSAGSLVVFYNDRMQKEGKPKRKLPENYYAANFRNRLKDRAERTGFIKLLKQVLKGKRMSSKEFEKELKKIGNTAEVWWKAVDWRDGPFILKLIVGEAEKVKNPYAYSWGNEFITMEQAKSSGKHQIANLIQELKKRR